MTGSKTQDISSTFPSGIKGMMLHLILAILTPFFFMIMAGIPIDPSASFLGKVVAIRILLLVVEIPLIAIPLAYVMKKYFYQNGGRALRPGITKAEKIVKTLIVLAIFLPLATYVDCLLFMALIDLRSNHSQLYLILLFFVANIPATVYTIFDLSKKIRTILGASANGKAS